MQIKTLIATLFVVFLGSTLAYGNISFKCPRIPSNWDGKSDIDRWKVIQTNGEKPIGPYFAYESWIYITSQNPYKFQCTYRGKSANPQDQAIVTLGRNDIGGTYLFAGTTSPPALNQNNLCLGGGCHIRLHNSSQGRGHHCFDIPSSSLDFPPGCIFIKQ
ncbi:MAG: hypothetical protein JSR85_01465 [Proteobacteria bacterium]|nr:hypothetical protein [Pseudomonadota bacterium]